MSKPKHDPDICTERDRLQMAEIERLRAALEDIAHAPARVAKWPDPLDRLLYVAKAAREALK